MNKHYYLGGIPLKKLASRIGIVSIVFVIGLLLGGATARALIAQPHMWNALNSLQNAQAELKMATADKGGHRQNALNLVAQAITQVHAGINYAAR